MDTEKGIDRRIVIGGVAVIAVLIVGSIAWNSIAHRAGEKAAERAIEMGTGGRADVDINGDTITVKTDQGTWSTKGELPDNWPADAPVYPNSRVIGSVAGNQQDYVSFVNLQSNDSVSDVAAWYGPEITAAGWSIQSTTNVGGMSLIAAEKETRTLSIIITTQDGVTNVAAGVAE